MKARIEAKQNETKAFSPLIKNGKYFVPPPGGESDFKEVFREMVSASAGRPVDKDGFPVGQWTPELLAEAISGIDTNRAGVDLRTVQVWFQENDKGISADNIHWLARIFGCGDPEASGAWQVELSAANRRLVAKRKRLKAGIQSQPDTAETAREIKAGNAHARAPDRVPKTSNRRFDLARKTEALYCGAGSLNLPVAIWACGGLLWLLVYIVGVHRVTYSPMEGLEKQVGFLWAPSWTVDRMVFIPLFVVFVSGLLNFWRTKRASLIALESVVTRDYDEWSRKVASFTFSFWAILIVCLVIVFLVQWSGVYLRPLTRSAVGTSMVDWILVAIVRPDIVTIPEAIVLSGLGNLYSAFAYWCYFCGLLLLYIVTNDYHEIFRNPKFKLNAEDRCKVVKAGTRIAREVCRCAVFGLLSATCIKLNAVYLISDTEHILTWLINDALTAMGLRNAEWGWLTQSPPAFMTSFFVVFLTCFIFFICLAQIFRVVEQMPMPKLISGSVGDQRIARLINRAKGSWLKMIGVVILLAANFMLIGQFTGFSILLFSSVIVATYSVTKREGGST